MILQVDNIYTDCLHGNLTETQWKQMERELSFRPEGYQFSPMFNKFYYSKDGKRSRRMWDGWKRQFWHGKKRTYFPTGLLSIVRDFLKKNHISFTIQDIRQKPEKNFNIETISDLEFYPYQREGIDISCNIGRGILQLPTGAGKTIMGGGIIAKLGVSPFMFFVTSIDLLTQTKESFEAILRVSGSKLKVGQLGGGVIDIKDVNVCTVQTAVRALGEKWNSKYKFDDEDTDDETPIEKYKHDIRDLIQSARGSISDECISGESIVITRDGPVKMKNLSNYVGREILSFSNNSVVWKKITHFYPKGLQKTIKIVLINGNELICTKDHPIMTNQGWKLAGDIEKTDMILCYVNANVAIDSISSSQEEDVFDITVDDTHCFFANNMLVHNCQHWRADTCQLVARELKSAYYTYGLSATPYRDSGDDMMIQACFGKQIFSISASELIQQGFLVKPDIKMVHIRQKTSKFKQWQSIYKEQVVENEVYNGMVANIANAYINENRLVLVLVKQIQHGKVLSQMIPGSVFLSGASSKKDREANIKNLRNKYISCIVASTIFDEGIDVRALDTVLLAGQGKSPTRAMQRIGRTLRKYEDENGNKKMKSTAVDFCIHQKYLKDHAIAREKMYRTEPEFCVEDIDPKLS